MGSTRIAKNEGKRRSDMGYFDSVFKSLGPLRFQEIDWKKQGYTSLNSASTSFRAAAKKRNVSGVCVRTINDKLYVYSSDFLGVLPYELANIRTAFQRANAFLTRYPEADTWPIPKWLIPKDENLSGFQIAMKLRDDLKTMYPYLSVTTYGKDGYAINRDKSYGSLCCDSEVKKSESPVDITEEPVNMEASMNTVETTTLPQNKDDVFVRIETRTGDNPLITAIPEIPFEMASDLGEYLSSKGYEVNMKIFHGKDRKCYAILSYSKGA